MAGEDELSQVKRKIAKHEEQLEAQVVGSPAWLAINTNLGELRKDKNRLEGEVLGLCYLGRISSTLFWVSGAMPLLALTVAWILPPCSTDSANHASFIEIGKIWNIHALSSAELVTMIRYK